MNPVFLVLLISVFVTLIYIIRNLLVKVEKLEDIIVDHQKYIFELSGVIEDSNKLINEIDSRGTFRSDDEVGAFFEHVKEIQSILDGYRVTNLNEKKNK